MLEHETEQGPATPAADDPAIPPVEVPPAVEPAAPAPAEAAAPEAAGKPRERRGRPRLKIDELVIGTEVRGKVVGLAKFGAFVDIGAVTDGLVHVTELGKKRVRKVEDALQEGDEVDVWIKEVDLEHNRVSLSMRRKAEYPIAELDLGHVLTGTVTSTTDYGVFVDIGSDTEGLVHISEMSSGYVQKPGDLVSPGDRVEVRVKEIDLTRERISLSMVGLANDMGLEVGDAAPERAAAEAEPEVPAQPEERMPTVVELALRRALGEAEAPEPRKADKASAGKKARQDNLGEVYQRMLAEYRATKPSD